MHLLATTSASKQPSRCALYATTTNGDFRMPVINIIQRFTQSGHEY
jgi:hypothetical protein